MDGSLWISCRNSHWPGTANLCHARQDPRTGGSASNRSESFARRRRARSLPHFICSLRDGGGLPLFKPGQYITVRIPDDRGQTTMRNYSLSNAPGEDYFRISVKQEPKGFVSGFLHKSAKEGTQIEVGPPCGEFFIDLTERHERPLMLLSAGVGITPLLSMLLSVLKGSTGARSLLRSWRAERTSARLPGLRASTGQPPPEPQSSLSLQRSHGGGPDHALA